MKTALLIIAIIIIALVIVIAKNKSQNTNSTFMQDYTSTPNSLLVDIRTPEEFNSGHIKDALNINFYDADFIEQVKKVATGKSLFIYCRSGARSGNAKALLQKEGFAVQDLEGGISSHQDLIEK